ncbi:MAG: hypothetical protein K2X66_07880 [Cyanobacteria bacterium]|nr:hypothetical protein [Cyanobacteriota bacterium]
MYIKPFEETCEYPPIALPPLGKLVIADANDEKTLIALEKEKTTELWLEAHECKDFVVDRASGFHITQVKCVTINGARFNLVPGKNMVPWSVFEFIQQSQMLAKEAVKPILSRNLGTLM